MIFHYVETIIEVEKREISFKESNVKKLSIVWKKLKLPVN
jgi:hypothetical protein